MRISSSRYYDIVRDVRQNKGSILKASVDYIRKLKNDQHRKRQLEDKIREQEMINKKLLIKLQEYEAQMKACGIPVQSFAWKPVNATTTAAMKAAPAVNTTTTIRGIAVARPVAASNTTTTTATTLKRRPATPDLEAACHLSSKQLEDLMDDDCGGPVRDRLHYVTQPCDVGHMTVCSLLIMG